MRLTLINCLLTILVTISLGTQTSAEPGLPYIQNQGQWKDESLFGTYIKGGKITILPQKIRFTLATPAIPPTKNAETWGHEHYEHEMRNTRDWNVHIYDMVFSGADPKANWEGGEGKPTVYNYYLSKEKSNWVSGVSAYASVYGKGLYPGVDLKVYSEGNHVKYEWIVAPGATPDRIQMHYEGASCLELREDNLLIGTTVGDILELQPFAYQYKHGKQIQVPCYYTIQDGRVSYLFPEGYDKCYELVIDPILIFSAYSGSTQDNWGNTATYDEGGNVYSAGMVSNLYQQAGFPVTPGAYQFKTGGGAWDIGILKYDSAGKSLLYATYLGGANTETPQSMVVNSNNELLILGATGSSDFPVTNASMFKGGSSVDPLGGVPFSEGTDIFVAKLNATGTHLLGATYVGGAANDGLNFISGNMSFPTRVESPLAKNYGDQLRGDIIFDEDNNVYFASNTRSSDFPAFNVDTTYSYRGGSHDGVVVKLTPDLSDIIWSRLIGGNGTDVAFSIKIFDSLLYVAGGTNSSAISGMDGLHTLSQGGIDGWIQSMPLAGDTITHGTFLGTSKYDQVYFIDINAAGEVYAFGQTLGNYPIVGTAYSNLGRKQFLHKLSGDLSTTHFSTVIGGAQSAPDISPTAFLVSDCGYIYLAGWGGQVNSTLDVNGYPRNYVGGNTLSLPVTIDAQQIETRGSDFYLMVLGNDGQEFLHGTFLGGSSSATHVDGGTSRFDKQGIVYHAVCAGCGGSSDFPAENVPLAHRYNNSYNCNNAVFKYDLSLLKARLQTNTIWWDQPGITKICYPDTLVFENLTVGGLEYYWDLGDTTFIRKDKFPVIHAYKAPGVYPVKLVAVDEGTCLRRDTVETTIYVYGKESFAKEEETVCEHTGVPVTIWADGGAQYLWKNAEGQVLGNTPQIQVSPDDTTKYYVTITEASGCITRDDVTVNVIPRVAVQFEIEQQAACEGRPYLKLVNTTTDALDAQMTFDCGNGETSDLSEFVPTYTKDSIYTISLTGTRSFCVYQTSKTLPVYSLFVPNVITPSTSVNKNDTFSIRFGDKEDIYQELTPGDFDIPVSIRIFNRWGKPVYEAQDYQYDWSGQGLDAGVYYYEVDIKGYAVCKSWVHLIK